MKRFDPERTPRRLKRLAWVAIWGTWFWAGTVLYRVLPRGKGSLVCRLPLSSEEQVAGFLGDDPKRIVTSIGSMFEAQQFSVYEIPTGARTPMTPEIRRDRWGHWRGMGPYGRWDTEVARNRRPSREDWFGANGMGVFSDWVTVSIHEKDFGRTVAREWSKGFDEFDFQSEDEQCVANHFGEVRFTPGANWMLVWLFQIALAYGIVRIADYLRQRRLTPRPAVE